MGARTLPRFLTGGTMNRSRRRFLELSGTAAATALATKLFGVPDLTAENSGGKPSRELSKMAEIALVRAKKLGATYADIRINRYRDQVVSLLSTPVSGGQTNHVPSVNEMQIVRVRGARRCRGDLGFCQQPPGHAGRDCPHCRRGRRYRQGKQRAPEVACPTRAGSHLRGKMDHAAHPEPVRRRHRRGEEASFKSLVNAITCEVSVPIIPRRKSAAEAVTAHKTASARKLFVIEGSIHCRVRVRPPGRSPDVVE
jgi:hypothetical protein